MEYTVKPTEDKCNSCGESQEYMVMVDDKPLTNLYFRESLEDAENIAVALNDAYQKGVLAGIMYEPDNIEPTIDIYKFTKQPVWLVDGIRCYRHYRSFFKCEDGLLYLRWEDRKPPEGAINEG